MQQVCCKWKLTVICRKHVRWLLFCTKCRSIPGKVQCHDTDYKRKTVETTAGIPYSGKISRGESFRAWLFATFCVASFRAAKASNPRRFSQRKSYIFHQSAKAFSLESFPLCSSRFMVIYNNIQYNNFENIKQQGLNIYTWCHSSGKGDCYLAQPW